MVTGISFLIAERAKINEVAEKIIEIDGLSEVYSVGGRYDLVAIIRARNNEQLAEIVTEHMLKISEIKSSETMIAFKVYSKHDLERMFSVGMEQA